MEIRERVIRSLFEYLATQYCKKLEDIATDAFAYLLKRHKVVRGAVDEYLRQFGYNAKSSITSFNIRTRRRTDIGDVPDIAFMDEAERCRAIFESKVSAGLTKGQPASYLRELACPDDALVFIVPQKTRPRYWEHIQRKCLDENIPIRNVHRFFGTAHDRVRKRIGVVAWEDLIDQIAREVGKENQEVRALLDEIRRVSSMEAEEFMEPLASREIRDIRTAKRVTDYMALADQIARESGPHFQISQDQKDSFAVGSWGFYGKVVSLRAWIGFDTKLWHKYRSSPIWIEFDDETDFDGLCQLFRLWIRDKRCLVQIDRLAFPIMLRARSLKGELVEEAVKQIAEIKRVLQNGNVRALRGSTAGGPS